MEAGDWWDHMRVRCGAVPHNTFQLAQSRRGWGMWPFRQRFERWRPAPRVPFHIGNPINDRLSVYFDEHAGADELGEALETELDEGARQACTLHPNHDPERLWQAALRDNEQLGAIARSAALTAELAQILADTGNMYARRALAGNPNTPAATLAQLHQLTRNATPAVAGGRHRTVSNNARLAAGTLARNPSTPPAVIDELREHPSANVRAITLSHPATPIVAVRAATTGPDPRDAIYALGNPTLDSSDLHAAAAAVHQHSARDQRTLLDHIGSHPNLHYEHARSLEVRHLTGRLAPAGTPELEAAVARAVIELAGDWAGTLGELVDAAAFLA